MKNTILKKKTKKASYFLLLFSTAIYFYSCKPVQNLKSQPESYKGAYIPVNSTLGYNASKKTVFIVGDNKLTEIFDMLAPFYLFNATGEANVYIVAKDKSPIFVKKGLYVVPQFSFHEIDSLAILAGVIVIPALSIRNEYQDTVIISWLKKHFHSNTKMLAVCDGSATAAATGLYDGKPLTTHASDYKAVKAHFPKPAWVQGVTVTKSGNLFSTAGVSNAVEGSLTIIQEIFGAEVMQKVAVNVHYPHAEIQTTHQSIALNGKTKFTIAKKIIFRKNKKIGLLLENDINEFEMAGIIDTYGRTFPATFQTFMLHDVAVRTKYGLTLLCTDDNKFKKIDELHIITAGLFSKRDSLLFKHTRLIRYDNKLQDYPIEICLKEIGRQYGYKFQNVVKLLLDYN